MKTVRDSKKVWPYCGDCGCRLDYMEYSRTELKFFHFNGDSHWSFDAAGCHCPKLFQAWVAPKHRVIVGV